VALARLWGGRTRGARLGGGVLSGAGGGGGGGGGGARCGGRRRSPPPLRAAKYFNYNDQGSTRAYLCMWYDVPYLNSQPYVCDLLSWRGSVFTHP